MKGNTNAAQSITVDNVLSTTSTNPVQNKAITAAVNANTANIATNTSDIANLEAAVAGVAGVYEIDVDGALNENPQVTASYNELKAAIAAGKSILIKNTWSSMGCAHTVYSPVITVDEIEQDQTAEVPEICKSAGDIFLLFRSGADLWNMYFYAHAGNPDIPDLSKV